MPHSGFDTGHSLYTRFSRAMTVAQLLKIDQPNPPLMASHGSMCKINPKFMWFRIMYMDSYLSLMLGLPQYVYIYEMYARYALIYDLSGGQDTNMEHDEPGETPSCKLERKHTLVARRIIDRNRRHAHDLAATKTLDQELLDAAR